MAVDTKVVLGIGVAVLIGLILAGWFLKRRFDARDKSNNDTGTERLAAQEREKRNTLPLGTHTRSLPTEAKVAMAAMVGIALVIAYQVWSYFKTGSPSQMVYATEFQIAVAGAIIGIGAISMDRRYVRSVHGKVDIEFEAAPEQGRDESHTKTVYFDPRDVLETEEGLVIYEYTKRRRFWMFRRPKRIAESKRLRNDETYRPHDDKIAHEIPERAAEIGPNHYTFRTRGDRTTSSPTNPADIEYLPAYSMSHERKLRLETDTDMALTAAQEKETDLARKDERIRQLERQVELHSGENWEDFIEKMEQVAHLFGNGHTNQEVLQQLPDGFFDGRSPRQQQSGAEANGTGGNGMGNVLDGIMGGQGGDD